jgi:hypothetical protein
MQMLQKVFRLGHFVISVMFVVCAIVLIGFAGLHLWESVRPTGDFLLLNRLNEVMEGMALLTVSVAALELGQTIMEEEVRREAHMAAPTRVRRFLSRFMVVLVVALSIESLVIVFRSSHDAPEHLPYAASVGGMAAALLAAWGLFIWFNRTAEELEPEAMEEAKREDDKISGE